MLRFIHSRPLPRAVLVLILLAAPVFGQRGQVRFDALGLADGLSQNSVRAILQDRSGFMWFGTQEGLNLYDGYSIVMFHHDPEDPGSLSGSYAYSLLEDRDGVIWVGTWDSGLNRFDRQTRTFKHYLHNPKDPKSLANPGSNRVWSMTQDSRGIIWLSTGDGGVGRFNPQTESFEHDLHDPENPHSIGTDSIRQVFEDGLGRMWVATRGAGLARYDRQTGHYSHYRHDPNDPTSIGADRLFVIMQHSNGTLWVGTEGGGLDRFDPDTGRFFHHRFDESNPNGPASDRVTAMVEDRFGRLWLGSIEAGVSMFDPDTGRFTHYPHRTGDPESFSSNFVYTLYRDRSGILWGGTEGGGVNRFDPAGSGFSLFRHVPGAEGGITNNKIFPIAEDHRGFLWIGTQEGGLNRFDPIQRTFTTVPVDHRGSTNEPTVYAVLEDPSLNLWVGTEGGGLQKFDPETKRFKHWAVTENNETRPMANQVYALSMEGRDTMLVGTVGDGFGRLDLTTNRLTRYRHDPNDPHSLTHDRVISFFTDSRHRLWVGTLGGGLNRERPDGDGFDHYRYDRQDPTGIGGNMAFAFHEDERGLLWIGTNGGLCRFDPTTDQFKVYRTKHGLPNNVIYGLLKGDDNRFWMSTNRGISSMDPETETFTNYDSRDGLQSDEFNFASFCKHSSGELYFGGINGLNAFFPKDLRKSNYLPPVVLTNLLINNQPVQVQSLDPNSPPAADITFAKDFTLDHTQGMFTLEFAALDYAMPGRNQYAYQLEGYNDTWIQTGADNRRATYTNLPEGSYTFNVKGSNHDGVWSDKTAQVKIHILSHPLLSWWAKTLYGLIVALIIGGYIQMQRRHLKHERSVSHRLRQVDRMREEFLANTSHELRTPLHGMIGLAESIAMGNRRDELSHETRENLALIIASGKRLANLVNDLLDFSKLNNRGLEFHVRAIDPRSAADVVLELTRPLVSDKTLELRNKIPKNAPPILADETRLMQILHNLIGNAVKFTRTGNITVSAEVEGDHLAVSISDTGIGISEDQFDRIFQSFEQAEGGIARQYGGTGLGLAVTRKLLELQGGAIRVDSKLGTGSTFTFTLPIAAGGEVKIQSPPAVRESAPFIPSDAPSTASPQPEPLAQSTGEHTFHILIVDDEPVNRRVLVNHLARENYQLTQANDGFEALAALEEQPFDLVLLDVMMPKMTGYEVCAKLRTRYPLHDLPVIFLTARTQVEDVVSGFGYGANDYLTKPVMRDELLSRVKTHLQLLDSNRNLESKVIDRTRHLLDVQKELMEEAHTAGMAEIAVEVLHNIGNRLNSLSTSVQVLETTASDRKYLGLLKRIGDHWHDAEPPNTSAEDDSRKFADALNRIVEKIGHHFDTFEKESSTLAQHMEAMRSILLHQQEYTQTKGQVVDEDLNDLVIEALHMASVALEEQRVKLNLKLSEEKPHVVLNRARFIRTFLCLIHNAGEAVREKGENGLIEVETRVVDDRICVMITDNGVGIAEENKLRIFSHGFTTKENRRGFGLHYSANAVKEMDGRMDIQSEGPGKGAQVTLTFNRATSR